MLFSYLTDMAFTMTPQEVAQHQAAHGRGPRRLPREREKEPQSGTLAFTLPVAPSVNHAYATVGNKRVMTKAGKDFKKYASEEAGKQALVQRWKYPEGARVSLTLRFVMAQANSDVSNRIKIAEDSITEGLGFNDRHVWLLVVERLGIDRDNPRCDVEVSVITEAGE